MSWIALVVGKYMLRQAPLFVAALMERFVVQSVLDLLRSSEKATPVVSGVVMPECRGCRSLRAIEKEGPRDLIKLPIEVTQDNAFSIRGLPILLCEFCDII